MKYNNTTNIPDKLIAIAVAFSIADGVEIEQITVKNKKAGIVHGQWGWHFPDTKEIVIIAPRIVENKKVRKLVSKAELVIADRMEFLIAVTAHELRHAWQHQKSGWSEQMINNTRVTEIDAESFEMRQLMKWRAQYGEVSRAAASYTLPSKG